MTDKKTVRGKFPDDERDRMLKSGKIVKIERMFPDVKFWQLKLFGRDGLPSDNDPRKLAPACTSAFWHGMEKHIIAWDAKQKNIHWQRREAKKNEERKKK
jgi:hypothetical protein